MFFKHRPPAISTESIPQDAAFQDSERKQVDPHLPKTNRQRRRKGILCILLVLLVAMLILGIALGVGLGVGLTQASSSDSATSSSPSSSNNHSTPPNSSNTSIPTDRSGNIWQPSPGTPWQIELSNALSNTSVDVPIYDIDLFTNPSSTISHLHSLSRHVICYFSAGSYEPSRPDSSAFPASSKGKELDGWPGEYWLNVSSPPVRDIMSARLDVAVSKGCDGVDPDNVDGYDNDNGLALTQADAVDYVLWLADQAHSRGLSLGLKNAGAIIPQVIDSVQWCVNEQCVQYDECDTYAPFVAKGKPVLHIEYPDSAGPGFDAEGEDVEKDCGGKGTSGGAEGFSGVLKKMELDDWVVECPK